MIRIIMFIILIGSCSEMTKTPNEFVITNNSIGNLALDDSLNAVYNFYDSVNSGFIQFDELECKSKTIYFKDGEFILADSYFNDELISGLYTNSTQYVTKSGIRVGDRLLDVKKRESFILDETYEVQAIKFLNSGITAKIGQSKTTNYKDVIDNKMIQNDSNFLIIGFYICLPNTPFQRNLK